MAARGRRRQEALEEVARRRLDRLERLSPASSSTWLPSRPEPPTEVGVAPQAAESPSPREVSPPAPAREPLPPAVADLLPPALRAATIAPARRNVAGLLLLLVTAVLAAAVVLLMARPDEQPVPRARLIGREVSGAAGPSGDTPAPGMGPPTAAPSVLFVHVAGAVRRPGLVQLSPGARVADAVAAAGGVTTRADPASVNLARPVVDGEQVVVLRGGRAGMLAGAAPPAGPTGPGGVATGPVGAAGPGQPVDLNTATLEQLDGLPGIGPVLAQRILDWRTANGRFSTVEELGEVSGIGEATLGDLRPLVTVTGP